MSSYPGGYAGLLAVALATHALLGYTLGAVFLDRPIAGLIGALVADLDLLFPAALGWPLVHRGVTHTVLVAGVATAIVATRDRRLGAAFGAGYASQLVVDATTPSGVPLLYPFTDTSYYLALGTTGHSPAPTAALWACCLVVLWHTDELPVDGFGDDT